MDWEFVKDKVVIALLLLAVGFVFNYLLEKSKAKLALRNEAEKQRVVHIGETWKAMYESEAASESLKRELAAAVNQNALGDPKTRQNLSNLEQQSMEKADIVKNTAESNRFWLGDTVYAKVLKFHNIQMEMLKAFGKGDYTTYKKLETKLDAARMSISDYIDNPL